MRDGDLSFDCKEDSDRDLWDVTIILKGGGHREDDGGLEARASRQVASSNFSSRL